MTFRLVRTEFEHDGIFGTLYDHAGTEIARTLEHAYDAGLGNGTYTSKMPNGEYLCVRGVHRLHNMIPFSTFEITGITGHTNILLHTGNFNDDSEGCVLVGKEKVSSPHGHMITESRRTFTKIMDSLKDINQFTLLVE